jgi:predicted phage-related endonuclease
MNFQEYTRMAVALTPGKMFVKRKHELDDLLKQLDKVTPEAVDLLATTMNDADAPLKERLKCAAKLIDYKIGVSEAINDDDLKRQIAEMKASGPSRPLVPDAGKATSAPRLDMNTIQSV